MSLVDPERLEAQAGVASAVEATNELPDLVVAGYVSDVLNSEGIDSDDGFTPDGPANEKEVERKFIKAERELLWYLEEVTTEECRWFIPPEEEKKSITKKLSDEIHTIYSPGRTRSPNAIREAVKNLGEDGYIIVKKSGPFIKSSIVNLEITQKGLEAAAGLAEKKKLALERTAKSLEPAGPTTVQADQTRNADHSQKVKEPHYTAEKLNRLSEDNFWQLAALINREIEVLEAQISSRTSGMGAGGLDLEPFSLSSKVEQGEAQKDYFGNSEHGRERYIEYLNQLAERMDALIDNQRMLRDSVIGAAAISEELAN